MKNLLFKVKETFDIRGLGLVLLTCIPPKDDFPKSSVVYLVKPDLSILKTEAFFQTPFLKFTSEENRKKYKPAFECVLPNLKKEEVPIGTEVWMD